MREPADEEDRPPQQLSRVCPEGSCCGVRQRQRGGHHKHTERGNMSGSVTQGGGQGCGKEDWLADLRMEG